MRRYSDIAVPKPLLLLNYTVNVATVKVERQGNLKHIFLLKYSSLFTKRTLKQCWGLLVFILFHNYSFTRKKKRTLQVPEVPTDSQLSNAQEVARAPYNCLQKGRRKSAVHATNPKAIFGSFLVTAPWPQDIREIWENITIRTRHSGFCS